MNTRTIVTIIIIAAVIALAAFLIKPWEEDQVLEGDNRAYELQELDLALAVPPELNDLTHDERTIQGLGTVLAMRASTLPDASGTGCMLGMLYTIEKSDVGEPGARWDQAGIEAGLAGTGETPPQVKAFDEFYLIFEPSQAVCSTDEEKAEQEMTKRSALWQSLRTATETD
jgi:hypothetical protein